MSFFRRTSKKKAAAVPEFSPPEPGDTLYDEVGEDDAAAAERSRTESRRRGNFMDKPADGWKHDDRGMAAGMGIYFTFTVKFVGSMVMPTSISAIAHEAQTDITREALALVCDASIQSRLQVQRALSTEARRYKYGEIRTRNKNIKLSISATGIVLAPVGRDDAIIAFYPMKNISLATGGEDLDYDFVSFTARNEQTKERESHVFDCDIQSDAVMEALGQAFSLARDLQAQAGHVKSSLNPGYLDVVPEGARAAMAPPPGAEALYADLDSIMKGLDNPTYGMKERAEPSYLDVKPLDQRRGGGGDASYMDVKPFAQGGGRKESTYMDVKPDPVGFALATQLAKGEALYDSASAGMPMGARMAQVLNEHDTYMDLVPHPTYGGSGDHDTYLELPSWKAYDDAQLANIISMDDLDEDEDL